METQEARNYNLEFCEALLKHPRVEHPQLFDLLSVAEELIGDKIWLVEEAIWEVVNIPEVQVSYEEREHLKKLIADLKEKHTAEVLATVNRVSRAFNPSADEGRIQTVISNAIKTSTLAETTPQPEAVVIQPEPTEEHKPSLVSQAQPEPATQANIETLKQYLALGIKLIPVYDNGAFIKKGSQRDFGTDDISEVKSLINGNGYRDGLGRGRKIRLFRFFPIDYGLVVIDIDRHRTKDGKLEKSGSKNWLQFEAELNLPQNCKIMTHTCCVLTPSEGFHLYYRTEGKVEFQKELTTAVDIPKTVNVAGSVKAGREYQLTGSLDTIPTLPDELKKLMLKPTRIEPQQIRRVGIPQGFSNGNKYLSREELDAYKPFLREYLDAKGLHVNAKGLTNCPFTEHHNNGDKNPSAQVNHVFLYCFTAARTYTIWGVAKQLNGGDFRAACADVVNTLGRR